MAGVWREEGLKLSMKQLKRGRLWFIDGSCVQLRSVFKHQIRSDDFVADRTQDGRPLRILTLIDEYRREFTAMKVRRNFKAQDVVEVFLEQFLDWSAEPSQIRQWIWIYCLGLPQRLEKFGVKNLFIEPVSHWENGFNSLVSCDTSLWLPGILSWIDPQVSHSSPLLVCLDSKRCKYS